MCKAVQANKERGMLKIKLISSARVKRCRRCVSLYGCLYFFISFFYSLFIFLIFRLRFADFIFSNLRFIHYDDDGDAVL